MGKVNDNYYLKIIQKYPLAWKVIERLANLKTSEAYFDKIPYYRSVHTGAPPLDAERPGKYPAYPAGQKPHRFPLNCSGFPPSGSQ